MIVELSIEDQSLQELERRFGSNKAALSDYLQRRRAAGFPDHRPAGSQQEERRLNEAAVAEVVKARAEGRKPDTRAARTAATAPASDVIGSKAFAAPLPPKPRTLTAEEQAAARGKARRDAVMASPHAKGRESTAAGLLGGAPNLSAQEIITALATMPTDAQAIASVKREAADAVWDRAYGNGGVTPDTAASSKQAQADDVWGRIYGSNAA